ncbi:MAG: DMT family transporter [Armatimonadota bacterium]|nr:DMT family transporter [Armatimonadota bacterium]
MNSPTCGCERSEAESMTAAPASVGAPPRLSSGVVLLVLLLCATWGGLAPAIKVALTGVPPVALAAWRFLVGLLAILAWCWLRGIPVRPGRGHATVLAVIAVLFVAQIALLNVGTRSTSGGHSILLLSTHPLFVALFAHFFLPGDRLNPTKLAGLILAFLGVAAVLRERMGDGSLGGDALVLVSALLLGALLTLTKWALRRGFTPYETLVWEMVPGVAGFFLLSRWLEGPLTWPAGAAVWTAILYQGLVVAGFAFVAWTLLLERYPASRLTAFQFTTPVFGVVFSALLLGEPLTRGVAAGTALVGAGLLLANR